MSNGVKKQSTTKVSVNSKRNSSSKNWDEIVQWLKPEIKEKIPKPIKSEIVETNAPQMIPEKQNISKSSDPDQRFQIEKGNYISH